MSKTVTAYTIDDIAQWQMALEEKYPGADMESHGEITLPTLQRGFVWKPQQMEALWDSILRGYPIGSLLMSKRADGTKYLLDGQQRCTTIALGFQNPLVDPDSNLLNIKKHNIPCIWVDLKPLNRNKHGLKFAVRVLTRSHPWGYRLNDHTQRVSISDQRNALDYLKKRCRDKSLGFSEIEARYRTPWDSHYPIPLSFLLRWDKEQLKASLKDKLQGVCTKYGACRYEDIDDAWLDQLYKGVDLAKSLMLPEILVRKESLEAEDHSDGGLNEQDATLFLRLNSSGTRISGQELIYSLLKASFPQAKKLVEKIGLDYLAPSTVVNLFVRFVKMKRSDFNSFERAISLENFRRLLKEDGFKEELEYLISSEKAEELMRKIICIISRHPHSLPAILRKEMIARNTDLILVLLVFLFQNNNRLEKADEKAIRRSFLHSTLFSNSKEKRKLSQWFYVSLSKNGDKAWKEWGTHWDNQNNTLPFLLNPVQFKKILDILRRKYLENRRSGIFSEELLKVAFREEESILKALHIPPVSDHNLDGEVQKELEIEKAFHYWRKLCSYLFWNRQFLIIAQREYFNQQFKEFMAFDGIEDTNRPWDWDHIYPNSWVNNKKKISPLVKWLLNANGNLRALSFNENRSQSNNQSPEVRFNNKAQVQKDSLICANDLPYWLALTNADNRLRFDHPKVDYFVNAVLTRIGNIYEESYAVIYELDKIEKNV